MIQIWDNNQQAFRDPQFIRRYDAQAGAWIDCQEGKVFKDGSWETVWPAKPKKLMLYDAGKEYEDGFTAFYSTFAGGSGSVIKNTDRIILKGMSNTTSGVCINTPVNLMPYNKACANVEIAAAANDAYDTVSLAVHTKKMTGHATETDNFGDTLTIKTTNRKGEVVTLEADISQLTVNAYISVHQYYVETGYVYKIWLE